MSDNSLIGWTDSTWPIVAGCEHVSPGCDRCWSAKLTSGRLRHQPAYAGLAVGGRFTGQVRLLPERLDWPLHWRKPRRVFVCSAGDLFHKDVPDEFIAQVFAVMAATPQHTYQCLTKRHARMRSLLASPSFARTMNREYCTLPSDTPSTHGYGWPLPNVWLGVSVEDQHWADIRVPALLDTPAAVRWLSVEPLLGPIDLGIGDYHRGHEYDNVHGEPHPPVCLTCSTDDEEARYYRTDPDDRGLSWVVVGGESGPKYREMQVGWLTSVVDQCRDAKVPVYVKQDSGPRAGQQGRIPDGYWVHEYPQVEAVTS